jgi:5,10-methylenetetrahydromethanopterin reductase
MDYGLNFNGDQPLEKIKKGARIAEESGYDYIWVGENPEFVHPFPVIAAIAEATSTITVGSGIISPFLNRCGHIGSGFKVFREAYGDRFVIGIAPGDRLGLERVGVEVRGIEGRVKECLHDLETLGFRFFIGASEPKLLALGNALCDGVLLNYVNPEYVKWSLGFLEKPMYAATYSPSLLLPDEDSMKHLRLAAAVVAAGSNPAFQREFGLEGKVREIRDILRRKDYGELQKHDSFLLDGFTLSGSLPEIADRIDELGKLGIKQVVLGSPMSNNLKSIGKLASIISAH